VQAFLKNPAERFAEMAHHQEMMTGVLSGYAGDERTMEGVEIDWASRTAKYPEHFTAEQRRLVKEILLGPVADDTGTRERYHREWLGEIAEAYRTSKTKLIFSRVPRAPYLRPDMLRRKPDAYTRSLRQRPNTILVDEHLLEPLEKPEYFQDPFHLNASGCLRLTETLTRHLADAL